MTDGSITREGARAAVAESQPSDHDLEIKRLEARIKEVELRGRAQYFDLRNLWSTWLITWVSGLLIFHIIVAFGVGFGLLNFSEHQWLMPLVITENFLQVVGMGYIVIQFLYPNGK